MAENRQLREWQMVLFREGEEGAGAGAGLRGGGGCAYLI